MSGTNTPYTNADTTVGDSTGQSGAIRDRIPRLSGVGSGYVSRRNAVIAGGLVVVALLGIGVSVTAAVFVAAGLALGAAAGITIAMTDPSDTVGSLLGGIGSLVLIGLTGVLLVITLETRGLPATGVVAGSAVVGLGLVCFRVAAVGSGAVARTIAWILRVTIVTILLTALVSGVGIEVNILPLIGETDLAGAALFASDSPITTAAGFVLVSLLGAGSVWLLTAVLPPADAIPQHQRAQYRSARSAVRTVIGLGLVVVSLVMAAFYLLTQTVVDIHTPVVTVVESPVVRAAVLQASVVGVVGAGIIRAIRSTGATLVYRQPSWILSAVIVNAGILLIGVLGGSTITEQATVRLPVGDALVESAVSVVGVPGVAIGLIGVSLIALSAGLLVLPLMTGANILPGLTAGPRLTLFGTIGAVVAYANTAASMAAVTAGLVAGLVAWDVAAHSARRTADIGTEPAIEDGDFAHAGWSLSVGIGALVLSVLTRWVLGSGTLFEEQLLTVAALGTMIAMLLAALLWSR